LEEQLAFYGRTYGEDYVVFGYLTGYESGARLASDDFHAAYPKDFYGTPIEDIPMMEEITSAADVDAMIIPTTWMAYTMWYVRQWQGRFGVRLLIGLGGSVLPPLMPYYPDQLLYTPGLAGGAEYEKVIQEVGLGSQLGDSFSLIALLMIALVVLGNISERMVGGKTL
jgi:hypothetical protein